MTSAWGHSPLMVDAIYTMLLLICVSLMTIGFITFGRWCDDKLEEIVRWFQYRRIHRNLRDTLQAKLDELKGN